MSKTLSKIDEDLKNAAKSKDTETVTVLRGLKSAIHNKEIEKKKELSEDEVIEVLKAEAKQRKDSISEFKKGSRDDLVKKEEAELKIIEKYLPEMMADEEIEKKVIEAIKKTGASGPEDMGKVMGAVMSKLKGQADGNKVSAIVKKELSK